MSVTSPHVFKAAYVYVQLSKEIVESNDDTRDVDVRGAVQSRLWWWTTYTCQDRPQNDAGGCFSSFDDRLAPIHWSTSKSSSVANRISK